MRRDTTGLDLADDSIFGDLGDSFADGELPDAPMSAGSSITLSNLKRPRSRQSSIIGRNDPPIRPSSRGPNTPGVSSSFNIGLFRRRARQPSILGTARKPNSETGSVAHNSEPESDGDDNLDPEAESTPLTNRRSQQAEQQASPVPAVRRSQRKRKSDDAPAEASRQEKAPRLASDGGVDIISDSDSDVSELYSPVTRPPRPVTPVYGDEILAPPASSDSEDVDRCWPDIHGLAKRRRDPPIATPLRNVDDMSDASSPPSLTHSPNIDKIGRRGRSAHKRDRSTDITTADLASLLPKRRQKRVRDEFDIGGDSEGESDEEEEPEQRRTRSLSRRGGRAASRTGRTVSATTVLRPKQTPASVRRSMRNKKSYRSREDKENQSDSDDNENSRFQPLPDDTFDAGTGLDPSIQEAEELKAATRKFKEVDRWELEYEEVAEPELPEGR